MKFLSDEFVLFSSKISNFIHDFSNKFSIYKKLETKISLLEFIIEFLGIAICIKSIKTKKYYMNNELFKSINKLDNNSIVNIGEKTYKYISKNFTYNSEDFNACFLLDISNETQQNKDKDKETTTATIVHDLKTPILSCERALYLMMNGRFGELNDKQYEILSMCNNSLNFSKFLISNILCDYKLSQQETSLQLELFDCIELLKESVSEVNIFTEEKNIKLIMNTPKNLKIIADKNALRRVFSNLLYNAIAYSYIKTDIEIVINYNNEHTIFYIKNYGNYIPPIQLKNIFNKNISLENKFNKMGTGLGLYLSKELIKAHGGEMIAKSSYNNENIFGFKLKHCVLEELLPISNNKN